MRASDPLGSLTVFPGMRVRIEMDWTLETARALRDCLLIIIETDCFLG